MKLRQSTCLVFNSVIRSCEEKMVQENKYTLLGECYMSKHNGSFMMVILREDHKHQNFLYG